MPQAIGRHDNAVFGIPAADTGADRQQQHRPRRIAGRVQFAQQRGRAVVERPTRLTRQSLDKRRQREPRIPGQVVGGIHNAAGRCVDVAGRRKADGAIRVLPKSGDAALDRRAYAVQAVPRIGRHGDALSDLSVPHQTAFQPGASTRCRRNWGTAFPICRIFSHRLCNDRRPTTCMKKRCTTPPS